MRTVVNTPAFDFDELRFEWADVVLAAIGWGGWQQLERTLAEGLACMSDAEDRGEQVDAETLHASVVTFRRARGLLAGEDYVRWLADRSLSTEDVRAHFARAGLRERAGDRIDDVLRTHRPQPRQLAETIRGEAILSGRLHSWAVRLARCAAAALGLRSAGEEPLAPSTDETAAVLAAAASCPTSGLIEADARNKAPRVAALQTAERVFSDRVVTPERLERCFAEHQLGWQRFVWEEVTFAAEGAAREAALWVREEGMALGEVAGLAHVPANVREAYSDDVSELSGLLAAAVPGELVGPLDGDGGWRLVRMRERTPPGLSDAALHERASTELVEHALERYLAGRVTWHGEH